LDLALSPGEVGSIPSNVTARILPKTLFGEKYVELEIPVDASSRPIAAGDVIEQSSVSIETRLLHGTISGLRYSKETRQTVTS